VAAIAKAGACSITPIVLHLRPGAREWFMSWLAENYRDLVPMYERLYARSAYAPKAYQDDVCGRVRELARAAGIGESRAAARRGPPRAFRHSAQAAPHEQLSLLPHV